MIMSVRALEFYSGIGGLHLAFSRSKVDGSIVHAFDWDQTACLVYAANHPTNIVQKVDISTLTSATLASYQADLWLLSPACQPYTVLNPNAKGEADPRARSFLHLIQNVLPELAVMNAHPSRLLIENVAGFETSSTRQILLSTLQSLQYTTLELLITPLQYGIPNSRLRYYLLAKLSPLEHTGVPATHKNDVLRHIPGQGNWVDPRARPTSIKEDGLSLNDESIHELRDYLNIEPVISEPHIHAVPEKVLRKWGRLFDIVLPSSQRTCCFTRGYTQLVERTGSILQENETLDTTETFDKFLQAQGRYDPQALDILKPLRLRYFSPTELLRLFHFTPPGTPSVFLWPGDVSTKTKYRLIGNSVNVKVVEQLIEYLFR